MLQPLSDRDSGYGELIDPPPSLWSMVEDLVPKSEMAEIKRILGEATVDLSLDLYAEMEVLLELWREVRSMSPSCHHRPLSSNSSILADPPVIKDMVRQEIRMLLLSVRRKARHQGLDEDHALLKYNPKVVSFVMGVEQPESRARSRRSGWSRPPSGFRAGDERALSSLSTDSSIGEELEELKDKLKVSDIDEVVLHLQSLFQGECRTLEKHIAFLQQCLEEDYLDAEDAQTPLPEPSLTELKEVRRTIERDLQLEQLPATPSQSSKMASTRVTKPARLLDNGRRCSSGNQGCRLSQKIPTSLGLHQYKASLAPCPPDSKLRAPDKVKMNKFSAVLGAPRATLPQSLTKGPVKPPGPEAAHKPMNLSGLEQISHNIDQDPSRALTVNAGNTSVLNFLPAQNGQPRPDTVFLPIPPPLQRPTNRSSAPSYRRVRTQLPS